MTTPSLRALRFRVLNVFTDGGRPFTGNPLCVFEDGDGLSTDEMAAFGRQLNLSETTFVLPPETPGATARVRIFTPTFEMPFAGHPTLGTAHVVRELRGAGDRVTLEMKVGLVEVTARGDHWTLRAAKAPAVQEPQAGKAALARMLGIDEACIAAPPLWVDTGSEQLVIPLASPADVARCRPEAAQMAAAASSPSQGRQLAYVWADAGDAIHARFFFLSHGGVVEDPATGSACANLGGYLLATGRPLPIRLRVHQGDAVGRPSRLDLRVDDQGIFVGGSVTAAAEGVFWLARSAEAR